MNEDHPGVPHHHADGTLYTAEEEAAWQAPTSLLEAQLRASITRSCKPTVGPQGWPDFVTFYMGRARNEGPVAMHGLPC